MNTSTAELAQHAPKHAIVEFERDASALREFLRGFGTQIAFETREREHLERATVIAIETNQDGAAERIARWLIDSRFRFAKPEVHPGGGQFGHVTPDVVYALMQRDYHPGFPGNRITVAISSMEPRRIIGYLR